MKHIAEYMGAEVIQAYPENKDLNQDGLLFDFGKSFNPDGERFCSSKGLKYNKSFHWLMPVVFKLCKEEPFYEIIEVNFNANPITVVYSANGVYMKHGEGKNELEQLFSIVDFLIKNLVDKK